MIDRNREQDYQADRDLLPEVGNVQQHESISDRGNQQDAHDRARDPADATQQ